MHCFTLLNLLVVGWCAYFSADHPAGWVFQTKGVSSALMEKTDLSVKQSKLSSGVDLSDENLAAAYEKFKVDDGIQYILTAFANNKVEFVSSGASADEMMSALNDDSIFFGILKATITSQAKIFSFSVSGENVNGMKKGKASLAKSGVLNYYDTHGELTTFSNGTGEVSRESLLQRIQEASRQADVSIA